MSDLIGKGLQEETHLRQSCCVMMLVEGCVVQRKYSEDVCYSCANLKHTLLTPDFNSFRRNHMPIHPPPLPYERHLTYHRSSPPLRALFFLL